MRYCVYAFWLFSLAICEPRNSITKINSLMVLDTFLKFFSFFESHLDYFDCCCCLLILATVTIYYCGGVITYYFLYWWWWSSVLPVCLTVKSLSYFQHPYRNQIGMSLMWLSPNGLFGSKAILLHISNKKTTLCPSHPFT